MSAELSLNAMRRLTAAEGFLELEMPEHALGELDQIDNAGPFDAVVDLLRGNALKAQHRFDDAIEPLQRAARTIPAPHNRDAWLSLGECFRQGGQTVLAEVVEMFANTLPIIDRSDAIRKLRVDELHPRFRVDVSEFPA